MLGGSCSVGISFTAHHTAPCHGCNPPLLHDRPLLDPLFLFPSMFAALLYTFPTYHLRSYILFPLPISYINIHINLPHSLSSWLPLPLRRRSTRVSHVSCVVPAPTSSAQRLASHLFHPHNFPHSVSIPAFRIFTSSFGRSALPQSPAKSQLSIVLHPHPLSLLVHILHSDCGFFFSGLNGQLAGFGCSIQYTITLAPSLHLVIHLVSFYYMCLNCLYASFFTA